MAASSRRPDRGEFELLARVRAAVEAIGHGRDVVVGIGDDAAVVRPFAAGAAATGGRLQVLTTDAMVEGVHFRRGWLTPRELGRQAFRAAVSDVAAMGARPRHVLLSLELPAGDGLPAADVLALVRAVAGEARAAGATLVGGNVSAGPGLAVHTTVVGETLGRPLLRNGARPGDDVWVSGRLGGASAGWRVLEAVSVERVGAGRQGGRAARPRHGFPAAAPLRALTTAYRRPPLRLDLACALAGRGLAGSMIDISDGLLQDLGHVAEASRVSIRVDAAAVPVHRAAVGLGRLAGTTPGLFAKRPPDPLALALGGGGDYELAFTARPRHRAEIEKAAAACATEATVIGAVAAGRAVVTDLDGRPFTGVAAGFDHLRAGRARTTVGRPPRRRPRTS